MGLKTVGTLTWEACKSCKHEGRKCIPALYKENNSDNVGCADYLSIGESEE